MFYKVKETIDEWDPIDLLAMHCPDDEYDEISLWISQEIRTVVDVENLAKYIYDLFVQQFGVPTFDKNLAECRMIAEKIIKCCQGDGEA